MKEEGADDSGRISRTDAIRLLKVTPGIMFAQGVTFDDVFETLEKWRLIDIEGDTLVCLDW